MPYTGSLIGPSGREYPVTFDNEPTQEDLDYAAKLIIEGEADTGQGLGSSAANAAARGAIGLVPSTIQGFGALIPGQEGDDIRARGKAMQESLESTFPVNPIYEDRVPVKAAGAFAQGVAFLGGALASGGSSIPILTVAGLAGAAGGADQADAYGLEGWRRGVATVGGAAAEVVSERLFGIGSSRFLKGAGRPFVQGTKSVGGEALEEPIAGALGDLSTGAALIGTDKPKPNPWDIPRRAEEFGYGAVGALSFGGMAAYQAQRLRGAKLFATVDGKVTPLPDDITDKTIKIMGLRPEDISIVPGDRIEEMKRAILRTRTQGQAESIQDVMVGAAATPSIFDAPAPTDADIAALQEPAEAEDTLSPGPDGPPLGGGVDVPAPAATPRVALPQEGGVFAGADLGTPMGDITSDFGPLRPTTGPETTNPAAEGSALGGVGDLVPSDIGPATGSSAPAVSIVQGDTPVQEVNEELFGPVTHSTDVDFQDIDLSKMKGGPLGPAVYATLEGSSVWAPPGRTMRQIKGKVRGKIIDLTEPVSQKDLDSFSNLLGREVKDAVPLVSLEKRYGSIAEGLKAAEYSAALHQGPGGTGKQIAVFDPANFVRSPTTVEDLATSTVTAPRNVDLPGFKQKMKGLAAAAEPSEQRSEVVVLENQLGTKSEYHRLRFVKNADGELESDLTGIAKSLKERAKKVTGKVYGKKFLVRVDEERAEFSTIDGVKKYLSSIKNGAVAKIYRNGNNQIVVDFEADIPKDIFPRESQARENEGPKSFVATAVQRPANPIPVGMAAAHVAREHGLGFGQVDVVSRPDMRARGWFDSKTGRPVINAPWIRNADEVSEVLYHELVHRVEDDPAMRPEIDAFMRTLTPAEIERLNTRLARIPGGYTINEFPTERAAIAISEAANSFRGKSGWGKLVQRVKTWWKGLTGQTLNKKDAEAIAARIVARAAAQLRAGKPAVVRQGNGNVRRYSKPLRTAEEAEAEGSKPFDVTDPKLGTRYRGMEGYGIWMTKNGRVIPVPDNHALKAKELFGVKDSDSGLFYAFKNGWALVRAIKAGDYRWDTNKLMVEGGRLTSSQERNLRDWATFHGYELEKELNPNRWPTDDSVKYSRPLNETQTLYRGGAVKSGAAMEYFTSDKSYAEKSYGNTGAVSEVSVDPKQVLDVTGLGSQKQTLSFLVKTLRDKGVKISSSDFRSDGDSPVWTHLQSIDKTVLKKKLDDAGFKAIKWVEWGPPAGEFGAQQKAEAYLVSNDASTNRSILPEASEVTVTATRSNGQQVELTMEAQEADAEHAAAEARGDTETGQRLVDEAAKVPTVYHGTPTGGFDTFNGLVFATDKESIAEEYTVKRGLWNSEGPNPSVLKLKLFYNNPLEIDAAGARNNNIPFPGKEWKPTVFGNLPKDAVSVSKAAEEAFKMGYDALVVRNVKDSVDKGTRTNSTVFAVKPLQAKSAEPFTYDKGKLIKLSDRFDTQSNDIRYSRPERTYGDVLREEKARDEAAAKAGYKNKMFFGGILPDRPRLPIFTTSSKEGAQWFADEYAMDADEGGSRVYQLYVRSDKSLNLDSLDGHKILQEVLQKLGVEFETDEGRVFYVPEVSKYSTYGGSNPFDVSYIPAVRNELVARGYDSLIGMDLLERDEIPVNVLIKDPSQVKLVESPFSQENRFNTQSDDIRYSLPEPEDAVREALSEADPVLDAETAAEDEGNFARVFGRKGTSPVVPASFKRVIPIIRDKFFDSTVPVTEESVTDAFAYIRTMMDKVRGPALAEEIRGSVDEVDRNIAMGLFRREIDDFALNMLRTTGDRSLFEMMQRYATTDWFIGRREEDGTAYTYRDVAQELAGNSRLPSSPAAVARDAVNNNKHETNSTALGGEQAYTDIRDTIDNTGLTPAEVTAIGDKPLPGGQTLRGKVEELVKSKKPRKPKPTPEPTEEETTEAEGKKDAQRAQRQADLEAERAGYAETARLEKEANAANRQAEGILNMLARSQSDTQTNKPADSNAIRKIYNKALTLKLTDENLRTWLDDKLTKAGVTDPRPAFDKKIRVPLTTAIITERAAREAVRVAKEGLALAEGRKGSLKTLEKQLTEAPPLQQFDPRWHQRIILDYFTQTGISKPNAEALARVYSKEFEQRLLEAKKNAVEKLLKSDAPWARKARVSMIPNKRMVSKDFEKLFKAVNLGLTDPTVLWDEELAKQNGWNGFTYYQHTRLVDIEERLLDVTTPRNERAQLVLEVNRMLIRAKTKPSVANTILASYVASALSGISTGMVQFSAHVGGTMKVLSVALDDAVRGDVKSALVALKAGLRAAKTTTKSTLFSLKTGAYSHEILEHLTGHERPLELLLEKGLQDMKSTNPLTKAKGLAKTVTGLQEYVMRTLSSLDEGYMTGAEEFSAAMFSRDILRRMGMTRAQANSVVEEAMREKDDLYRSLVEKDVNPLQAAADAADLFLQRLHLTIASVKGPLDQGIAGSSGRRVDYGEPGVSAYTLDGMTPLEWADDMLRGAKLDVEGQVGRVSGSERRSSTLPPGPDNPMIGPTDEGYFSSGLMWALKGITEAQGKGGTLALTMRALFGFIAIPVRTAKWYAGYSPYGFVRYGIHQAHVLNKKQSPYAQSYGSQVQIRQRLREATAGTVAAALLTALATATADDDDEKKNAIFVTGGGPSYDDATFRDAWLRKFKPYSIVVKIDGKYTAFNYGRMFESVGWASTIAGTIDDVAIRRKTKEARGSELDYADALVGNLLGNVVERSSFKSIINNASMISRAKEVGTSLRATSALAFAGTSLIPWKSAMTSLQRVYADPVDNDTLAGSIWSVTPVAGPLVGLPRVNNFGDPAGDLSPGGRAFTLGLPAFGTPRGGKAYDLVIQHGRGPTTISRNMFSKTYETDDNDLTYHNYIVKRGQRIKRMLEGSYDRLKTLDSETFAEFLTKATRSANEQTAAEMKLKRTAKK